MRAAIAASRNSAVASVEIVVGPSAGRGVADAPGPTTGRSHLRIGVSHLGSQSDRAGLLSVGFSTKSPPVPAILPQRWVAQPPPHPTPPHPPSPHPPAPPHRTCH